MKRSSSYKKRKRKTLNITMSKRRKQEGGGLFPELFLYVGISPSHYTLATLGHLNNLDLNRTERTTEIRYYIVILIVVIMRV